MSAPIALPDGTTFVAEKWVRIVGIIQADVPGMPPAPPGEIRLRSSEWALFMSELREKLPSNTPPEFFEAGSVLLGIVTLSNAGTDSARVVSMANQPYLVASRFEERAQKLITGRVDGSHAQPYADRGAPATEL